MLVIYPSFRGPFYLYNEFGSPVTLIMAPAAFHETSVHYYHPTRLQIPEHRHKIDSDR